MNYFETTTKRIQLDESGKEKKASEQHIMKAVCFTDAETTTTMNFGENEQFEITAIKRSKIVDIIGTGEKYFRVVAEFVSVDEASGKEKSVKEQYLFGAKDVNEAKKAVDYWLMALVVPTEIRSIVETKIVNVL